MSGQAKRSRVREAERRRRQVARLIALATAPDVEARECSACAERHPFECGICGGTGRQLDALIHDIDEGQPFDVALARAYGERLVREGTAALETWVVYLDWLRSQGWCDDEPWRVGETVGFGPSSRILRQLWAESEHVRVSCRQCKGAGLHRSHPYDARCMSCEGLGWHPGKRPRMDGTALVRMGRRLLAALEGQPSECQRCLGEAKVLVISNKLDSQGRRLGLRRPSSVCPDCRGTGHNLAGMLAPVEPSPQQRRKDARRDLRRVQRPPGLTEP